MKTKKSILAVVVLLALVFMQGQAVAGFYKGNDLVLLMREYDKSMLSKEANVVMKNMYMLYVIGVVDATVSLYNIPTDTTGDQVSAVVSKYLKNHPENWGDHAASLVIKALKEAFPLK